ncbi:MAG: tRNA pseudouridine(38-40) synthase TruA [Armatimonadetes bacterium]|nr:tRNA pseudouridine(38-40) synthase TruA [Armatimonadota bacterium]
MNLSTKTSQRIKLVVAYDGTEFSGWAAQRDLRTIQGTLRDTVRQVSGEDCEIVGASRTDAGAHARGQVCHFDSTVAIEPEHWVYVLNWQLPKDISVVKAEGVNEGFHARFSARSRLYQYRITRNRDPRYTRVAHWYPKELDFDKMEEAAKLLIGEHDFRAFGEELNEIPNSVRVIHSIKLRRVRHEIWIDIVGAAFMRGMMRRISGGLLEVGRGRRTVAEIGQLLDPLLRDKLMWPVVLPAHGLTLQTVSYGRHFRDIRALMTNDLTDE